MTDKPVTLDVEQGWSTTGFQQHPLTFYCVENGKCVCPIHSLRVHAGRVNGRTDTGQAVPTTRLTQGLSAHRVEVIAKKEQYRESPVKRSAPQLIVLCHSGKVHRLPDRTTAGGSIADVRHSNAAVAAQLLVQRGSHRNAGRGADNCVVRVSPEGWKEGMHTAAHAAVESVGRHENLCQKAEE